MVLHDFELFSFLIVGLLITCCNTIEYYNLKRHLEQLELEVSAISFKVCDK